MSEKDEAADEPPTRRQRPRKRDVDEERRSGSGFDLKHGVRALKVFPVTESDMLALKVTTALSTSLWSLGLALIGYGIEIQIHGQFALPLPASGQTLVQMVSPICLGAGAILVIGGIVAAIAHWITWGRVKRFTTFQDIAAK